MSNDAARTTHEDPPWRVFCLDDQDEKWYLPAQHVGLAEHNIYVTPHESYADGDAPVPSMFFIPWHRILLVEKR